MVLKYIYLLLSTRDVCTCDLAVDGECCKVAMAGYGGRRGLTVMVDGIAVKGNGGSGATPAGKGVHMRRER